MLLLPYATASLEVDEVRGYVNNERVTDINKDGGDFDVEQGDSIDLVVRIKNTENVLYNILNQSSKEEIKEDILFYRCLLNETC